MLVICDIDGTLALMNGRGPFEWDKVGDDAVNEPVAALIRSLSGYDECGIVFVSGRMEQCREATRNWLMKNVGVHVPNGCLFMRGDDDYRPDWVVKKDIWEVHIAPRVIGELGDQVIVLDDRNQTVQMWRELGLTCLQVAEGDF